MSHDFSVALAAGREVAAALCSAHSKCGEGVLERLLERKEFENGEIDRAVETDTALIRSYGIVVLDTVAHVVAHSSFVIYPRHTERKHPVGNAQALNKIITLEFRIFVIHILDGGHHLLYCLQIFRFVGKPAAQVVKQFCCFHQTITY